MNAPIEVVRSEAPGYYRTPVPGCLMCPKWDDDADLRIAEFAYCYVVLNRDQFFPGYCFVLAKAHVTELFHLDVATRQGLIEEVNCVAAALDRVFSPTKINYELLGNMVPHMHWASATAKHAAPIRNGPMNYLLFDLDNTLYPPERDLFSLIDVRINRFMEEIVGIAAGDVDPLRRYYWQEYGVTLQGLIRHFDVDPEAYLHFVHDVDVSSRLVADPVLAATLATLPQRKVVFTNGSSDHAERVLAALGIRQEFEAVFDIRIANYLPKPFLAPYEQIIARLGVAPQTCAMIEDVAKNLEPAKMLGMTTILVGGSGELPPFVDARIDTIHEIATALQRLKE